MAKEVYNVDDIAEMFDISKDTAYDYIRSIKSVSDTLGLAGKVHKQDYEFWLKERLGKQVERQKRGRQI